MRKKKTLALIGALLFLFGSAWAQEAKPELRTETKQESKPISFQTEYQFSRNLVAGRLLKSKNGKAGAVVKTYKLTFAGTRLEKKELVKTERIEPQNEIILMGNAGSENSRSGYVRGSVLEMSATAYDPSAGRGIYATGRTCTGVLARYGIAAVDPRVIPLGTRMYVEGYGFAIAADRGSAIKGKRIDLCYNDVATANRYGRKRVRVHLLRQR